jgi:hypothetical protein
MIARIGKADTLLPVDAGAAIVAADAGGSISNSIPSVFAPDALRPPHD